MRRTVAGDLGGLRGGGGQKRGFKEAFETEVAQEIEALVGEGVAEGLEFEAIEMAARRQELKVAARYAGRRLKTFQTVPGETTLSRAYYHCEPVGAASMGPSAKWIWNLADEQFPAAIRIKEALPVP